MLTQASAHYSQFRDGWGPCPGYRIVLAKALEVLSWLTIIGRSFPLVKKKKEKQLQLDHRWHCGWKWMNWWVQHLFLFQIKRTKKNPVRWILRNHVIWLEVHINQPRPRCHWPVGDVPRSFTPSCTSRSLQTLVGSHVCRQTAHSPDGQTQRWDTLKKLQH